MVNLPLRPPPWTMFTSVNQTTDRFYRCYPTNGPLDHFPMFSNVNRTTDHFPMFINVNRPTDSFPMFTQVNRTADRLISNVNRTTDCFFNVYHWTLIEQRTAFQCLPLLTDSQQTTFQCLPMLTDLAAHFPVFTNVNRTTECFPIFTNVNRLSGPLSSVYPS